MQTLSKTKFVDHVFDVRTEVRALETSSGKRTLEGIATTPNTDRAGDVVLPMGAKFQLPLPLLWMHDYERPVGNVTSAIVTPEGIKFVAEFARPGLAASIDQHWEEIKSGLVRYVSIGFRALKQKATKTGRLFEQWEWLELSAVTVPANGDASITAVKAFPVPERTPPVRPPVAASGASVLPTGNRTMKTLAEKIATSKAALSDMRDRLQKAVEGDIDESVTAEIEELSGSIEAEEKTLSMLEAAETRLAANAATTATPVATTQRNYATARTTEKADLLVKAATANFFAHVNKTGISEALTRLYPGHTALDTYVKAASAPATTTTTGWAAELVATTNAEFLESLRPLSVYAALTAKGQRFTFGRAGIVKIPRRAATPTLAGDFVGEGAPIPVKQGALTSVSLTPHKLAVISTFTRELAMHSTPAIESMVRSMILEDTANVLDARLLDNVAASAIRPAGLLNGVTPVASSGNTSANIATDIRALLAPIMAANGGRRLVWILNPARLVGLSMVQTGAGTFLYADEIAQGRLFGYEFIASNNVPANSVYLVDAGDFVSASNDAPEFDVSDVATLHMEDTNPDEIVDGAGAVAQPVRSLWQTASIGVRMIQEVSWAMRRGGMVGALSGVNW